MLTNNKNDAAKKKKQTGIFLNRLWADWQIHLHCYLSGTVLVTIESQWYSAETHCDLGTGSEFRSFSKKKLSVFSNFSVNVPKNYTSAPEFLVKKNQDS